MTQQGFNYNITYYNRIIFTDTQKPFFNSYKRMCR